MSTSSDELHEEDNKEDEESAYNNKDEEYVNHYSVIEFRIQSEIDHDTEELFWELRSFAEEMIVPIGDKLKMEHLQFIVNSKAHIEKK
jgi:hypothetical protein